MFTYRIEITNLTCEACVKLSESVLKKIDGVVSAEVDLQTGFGQVLATQALEQTEIITSLKNISKEAIILND